MIMHFDQGSGEFVPDAAEASFLNVPPGTRWPLHHGRHLLRVIHILEKGLISQDLSRIPLSDEGMADRIDYAIAEQIAHTIRHSLMQHVELSEEEIKMLNDLDPPPGGP